MVAETAKFFGKRLFNSVDALAFLISGALIGNGYFFLGPLALVPLMIVSMLTEAYVRRISA
jgi:hypothetical protein